MMRAKFYTLINAVLSIPSLCAGEQVTLVLNVMAPGDRDQHLNANNSSVGSLMLMR